MKTRIEKNKDIQNEINKEKYQKKLKIFSKLFIIIFIITSIIISYGLFIGAKYIVVKEFKITNNLITNNFHGLKIVHFSDLLYNSLNKNDLDKIKNKINNLEPDILIFTGDIQKKEYKLDKDNITILGNFFNTLNSNIKKYAILGNNDNDIFQVIMENSNFEILDNQEDLLYYKNVNPLRIIGFNTNNLNDNFDESDNYTICLMHNPDLINNIKTKCNLTLAGDNLGGEIKLPFINQGILNHHKYSKDYYKINNNELYISNGLGNNYKFRTFNQPSINLFRLTSY